MIYTVGLWWAIGYFILMVAAIIVGIVWFASAKENGDKPIGGIVVWVVAVIFFYLWIFAATHFRVGINERALLINTIDQTVIGVKENGVQSRPFLGVSVKYWPANTQYPINVTMKGGVQSATTKNGTIVYDDVTIYVDLSKMDIAGAYKAVNGDWNVFLEKNLLPGLLSVSRSVSADFSTSDHTVARDKWEGQFETEATTYLSDETKGFSLSLLRGRTVLSWDFVNPEDATAYDEANRAAYKITKNENEKAALLIEATMVETKNQMLEKTADGTIVNLDKISKYLQSQPAEIRPYLMDYLDSMADMEYLRIVSVEKPEIIIPPNGSVMVSTDSSSNTTNSQTTAETNK